RLSLNPPVFPRHLDRDALPSFPTRRSSDLASDKGRGVARLRPCNGEALATPRLCADSARGRGGLPHRQPKRDARLARRVGTQTRSEEHTSELQSLAYLVCRLLLEKKKESQA